MNESVGAGSAGSGVRAGFVVGIDVGGMAKGFHLAILLPGENRIHSLFHSRDAHALVRHLRGVMEETALSPACIAVDSPPQKSIHGERTRQAERELRQAGYRVLWTPRRGGKIQDWMENGEGLWRILREGFPETLLLETFPTASTDGLYGEDVGLPLSLFADRENRIHFRDYLDASIAAATARRALFSQTKIYGIDDELGPIHTLVTERRLYTLAMVIVEGRILLGMKKRGFGAGRWNGFGGKVESGESLEEAVARELMEEANIRPLDLHPVGHLHFSFVGESVVMEGHIFLVNAFEGEVRESEEMRPAWFDLDSIPYGEMWVDDILWLPHLVEGRRFRGHFRFDGEHRLLGHTLEIL